MLARFAVLLASAFVMNYTVWKADAVAFAGNNGPTYLTTYATPLAWFAYGLQPWHLFAALVFSATLHPFTTAVISATIYVLLWASVRWRPFFQRLYVALNWSTRGSLVAVAAVILPYMALLAYTLYTEHTYVSPPAAVDTPRPNQAMQRTADRSAF